MARNNMLGVINNPYSHILMFSDIEEGKYTATLGHMREYLAKAEELGYTNVHLNVSDENDQYRWWHAHPGGWDEGGNPDLFASESLFIPHILNGDYPEPVLSQQGNMVVLGYCAGLTGLIDPRALEQTIRASVPRGTEDLNLRAFAEGLRRSK